MSATLDDAKVFAAAAAAAKTTTYKDKLHKCAWDKAQLYVDQQELPASWDHTQLLGNMDLTDSDEVGSHGCLPRVGCGAVRIGPTPFPDRR